MYQLFSLLCLSFNVNNEYFFYIYETPFCEQNILIGLQSSQLLLLCITNIPFHYYYINILIPIGIYIYNNIAF